MLGLASSREVRRTVLSFGREFQRVVGIEKEPVRPEADFLSPLAASLHGWWVEAGAGGMPRRSRFDVAEHGRLVPNLFLVERLESGAFRFRVRGEGVLDLLGGASRGPFAADHRPADFGHLLSQHYQSVLDLGTCVRCRGSLAFRDRSRSAFESVDCPLADDAGAARYIIGVIEAC